MTISLILCLFYLLIVNRNSIIAIKIKKIIFPTFIIIFLICMVLFSKSSLTASHTSFMLWVNNVVPSLLPFFICIEVLKQTNFIQIIGKVLNPIMYPLFNVPGSGAFALAMGITSGYPVGAKVASDLYKENLCTKIEAERLLAFTNSSGPLFIIGAIGTGMFLEPKIGLLLFLTHFLASITVGILFRKYKTVQPMKNIISQVSIKSKTSEPLSLRNIGKIMSNAIQTSVSTLLLILGYIIFFAVLTDVLSNTGVSAIFEEIIQGFLKLFGVSPNLSNGIFTGILEITNGINKISLLNNSSYIEKIPTVAFVLGFGGFSVHMQVASIISDAKLSMKPYLLGKTLQGIFAGIYTYALIKYTNFFNWDMVESFNYETSRIKIISESNILVIVLGILFILAIIFAIMQKIYRTIKDT